MRKIKQILLIVVICMIIGIFFNYLKYYMYYDGYIISDMNTAGSITYTIEQILLSENSPEKKKEMIEKICSYSYSEITIKNLSTDTILHKEESGFINKNLFNELILSKQLIKTKEGDYSIEYKTYIPKFFTAVRHCIYLGSSMIRV